MNSRCRDSRRSMCPAFIFRAVVKSDNFRVPDTEGRVCGCQVTCSIAAVRGASRRIFKRSIPGRLQSWTHRGLMNRIEWRQRGRSVVSGQQHAHPPLSTCPPWCHIRACLAGDRAMSQPQAPFRARDDRNGLASHTLVPGESLILQGRPRSSKILFAYPFGNLLVMFQPYPLKTYGIEDVTQGSFPGADGRKARVCLKPESIGNCRHAVHIS